MDAPSLLIDTLIVLGFAVLYTVLDRKYKWFRVKYIYRESLWQNFLVNLAILASVFVLWSLVFGYTSWFE